MRKLVLTLTLLSTAITATAQSRMTDPSQCAAVFVIASAELSRTSPKESDQAADVAVQFATYAKSRVADPKMVSRAIASWRGLYSQEFARAGWPVLSPMITSCMRDVYRPYNVGRF